MPPTHSSSSRLVVFVLFVALASAIAQTSQQSSPAASAGATFTAGAELVLVPVVVRNKSGHVSDLTQADFSVFEDGQRQRLAFVKVTNTGVVLKHENKGNVFSNEVETGGDTPRVTVVIVDSANIPFGDQVHLRDSFRKFLIHDASSRGPTAVVSFQWSGVRVVQDFTTDPDMLAAVASTQTHQKPPLCTTGDATDASAAGDGHQNCATQAEILGILPREMPASSVVTDPNLSPTIANGELLRFEPKHGDDIYDLAAKNLQLREVIEMELRALNMLGESLSGIPGERRSSG